MFACHTARNEEKDAIPPYTLEKVVPPLAVWQDVLAFFSAEIITLYHYIIDYGRNGQTFDPCAFCSNDELFP